MWRFVFLVYLMTCWAAAQNVKTSAHQHHNGHGWDIRLAVPGEPGSDYPTLGAIPRTSFSCSGKEPGYYADLETGCQVFRVCTVGSTYGFQSFLCPNGTLFNQAVFVCDWWMNVNCPASEQLFNNNNDKFGNLRLGPQLMKDIKKMLTHPMRNPYEKAAMKSNLIVMQDYKPPFGQLFPNEALIAPERPNNIYVPAKQVQISSQNGFGNGDIEFAASTPDPRYIPAAFNTIQQSSQREAEVFQRQRQNGQYVQSNRLQSTRTQSNQPQRQNPFKTQVGQITQSNFNSNLQNARPTQSYNYNNGNTQYGQKQLAYIRPTQTTIVQNPVNTQRGQYNQQFSQYTNSQSPARLVNGKQSEFSIAYSKQQFNSKQEKQPYTYNQPQLQFSNNINGKAGNEAKQNLVSGIDDVPSTVIAKTLTLKRLIQDPKRGSPKSRITVKTWIVKPSKSAKLIEPTPYTYNKPTQQPTQKLIETTPYTYNRPTSQAEKQITELEQPYVYNRPTTQAEKQRTELEQPYVYNRPTTQAEKQITELEQPYVYNRPTTQAEKQRTELEQPYVYNKPTTPAKQIFTPSREVITTSTTLQPTLSRLYLSPTSSPPTQASRLYLAPTTYNPSSRLYLPPVEAPIILSRQYLAPSAIQQPSEFQSEKLRAAPTTPSPTYALPNTEYVDSSSYSESEQSHLNSNLKNLTFTDILTKEKLDLSVSDIVKDTSNYLYTASPEQFEPFRSINSIDYPEEVYLPPESRQTDSGEKLTSKTPPTTGISKSSRLVASPSVDLEPPVQTNTNVQNTNRLSKLPFYKESLSPRNTIERTVSLKISIPEKIASYLFKNNSESDYDKLEILNTGSSNYLVLTNNYVNKNTGTNFIPIGKLVSDKESNISNSQALVFSLLADSINVAKEYNTAQQDTIQTSPFQAQFQNINNDELAQITNKISQLTSSQYSTNNQGGSKNGALISATQTTTNNERNQDNSFTPNQFSQNLIQSSQRDQYNSAPSRANNEIQTQSSQYQSNNNENLQTNPKQLYSGQLYQIPVPDAQQIYNKQSTSANIGQSNSNQQNKQDIGTLSNGGNPSNADVEIVKSHSIQIPPAARLQASPTSELDHFNSQENFNRFINSNNGISAQLQDKIVGTIPHPLEDNKLVTYKKDESYYVYTKLDNTFGRNTQTNGNSVDFNNSGKDQNAKLIQGNNLPNIVAFQFIPSVSYQLEDEKEQQKILNAFNIDEYGSPKQRSNLIDNSNQPVLTTNVDYSVDHTLPTKQSDRQYNDINNLYAGPSSYSAPQASVGRLVSRQEINSKLELDDNSNNGYAKVTPSRQFTF